MPPAKTTLQPVQVIRLGLIGGVVMFGVVILFVHRQPGWTPATLPPAFGYALVAYALATILIAMLMQRRVASEPDQARRMSLLLAGWSAGEAAGLFGGVIFFLTGEGLCYVIGLMAMAITFALVRDTRAT